MNRKLPPFPALRAFEAAARHNSFTAAADELHVTHGAISRQVAAFEAWVGVQVFHRNGKRVRLTEDGRRYLSKVQDAFDSIATATDQLRDTGVVHVLRVNALPTFAMKWLLPRLSQFQRMAPNVELRLATSNEPVEMLDSFDVAVRRGPAHWPNCASGQFLDESEIPVCSPALLQRLPIHTADDLARHVLLHSDTRPDAWHHWLQTAGVKAKCRKKQSFDHFYLALQAAVDGLGVALGPMPLLDDELASGRLVTPLEGPRIDARGYWWVARREVANAPLVEQFCRWLEAQARETKQDNAQEKTRGKEPRVVKR
ncbi:LysR family transcriptional regulator, glycine cleavage system transcriptional activator [Burkholderia sp. YR290]|jgi:LysR family glycine cleavage system transcriptional activator|uniref:transcriptional regulator GcvA n=1 Tax=Paraburkholderia hospita TaxID=169430 RepID=UPI0009A59AB8|nr:transcriptional regulator GcvA [Paraburkholderia hospita]SKC86370.1 LysR family transcriptional regulator, glycine cleavage system transcriptional activator [Paraburkholderia hospita]SOE84821.1 LysR family transcriptional regulator, glycine cleavage system transcriptional activator [Burkholderia sp. YR290]